MQQYAKMPFIKTSTYKIHTNEYNVLIPKIDKCNTWAYKDEHMICMTFTHDAQYNDVTNMNITGDIFDMHTYTFSSEEDYVKLLIDGKNIKIIRRTPHGKLSMLNTTTSYIDTLLHSKQRLKNKSIFFTVVSDDRIFDRDISGDILQTVQYYLQTSSAITIQKNIRRWIMQRHYSKKMLYLLLEITHLPPKFVSPTFPGGTAYIELCDRFNTATL